MAANEKDSIYASSAFQEFFKSSQHSLVLKADAPKFTVLAVSDQYLNLVHKRRDEVLGYGLFEAFPGSEGDLSEQYSVYSSFCRVLDSGKEDILPVFKYEIFIAEKGTKETHYWTNINTPITNAAGQVEYLINNTANITDQVQREALLADVLLQIKSLQREQALNAELTASNEKLLQLQQETLLLNQELEARVVERTRSLAESEARFRNMAESSAVLIAVSDESNLPVYFNQAWTVLTGLLPETLLEIDFVDIIHHLDQQLFIDTLRKSRQQLQPWKMELRVLNKDGGYSWLLATGTPRYHINGDFAGHVSSCTDITENKEQQAELERLNLQLELSYQEKTASNVELAHVNDELIRIQEVLIQNNSQLAESEQTLVTTNQKLKENEQFLNLAIQSSAMGTWQVDLSTCQLTSSETSQKIHGLPEQVKLTIYDYLAMIAPDFQQDFMKCIRQARTHHTSFIGEYLIYPANHAEAKWVRMSGVVRVDGYQRAITLLGTLLDITEKKHDEARKNDFIGMVSHELKTPLTSINGYLQILRSKVNTEEQLMRDILAKASKQTLKMMKMINGFLNVSRLDSGKIVLNYMHFDLALLLQEIMEDAVTLITTHQLLFAQVEETWVNADRDKLGQVIENLISNAVKYSPLGSTINITCEPREDEAMISVKDEGFGIDKEDLANLFERFFRVKSHSSTISGFGIGLYLCREIISQHHGKLWVDSEPGQGSTFYFTVPVVIKPHGTD